tara:strand:- start:1185 stop:1442 length:258 start_codon:yes stop_codon:yes gene_type:complete
MIFNLLVEAILDGFISNKKPSIKRLHLLEHYLQEGLALVPQCIGLDIVDGNYVVKLNFSLGSYYIYFFKWFENQSHLVSILPTQW